MTADGKKARPQARLVPLPGKLPAGLEHHRGKSSVFYGAGGGGTVP